MDGSEAEVAAIEADAAPQRRARWPLWLAGIALVLGLGLGWAWLSRKQIADDLVASQLEALGLPSRYTVDEIGPGRQVLSNVVIGDPARPDLTVERIEVETTLRFGLPGIGRITLVRPRLYGTYRQGKASFGSLDAVLFTKSAEPFRLPDLDVAVVDGRALLETDFGPAGVKLAGEGRLRDGFAGILAATAPKLALPGCALDGASLYGRIAVKDEKPGFSGPLRLESLACPAQRLALRRVAVQADLRADAALDGAEATLALASGALSAADARAAGLDGTARLTWRDGALTSTYRLAARGLASPQGAAAGLALEGRVRAFDRFARIESEGTLAGEGLRAGPALDGALASAARAADGTFAAPMLAQVRAGVQRESRASRLAADFIVRRSAEGLSLVVPQAALRGTSGQTLLALSRFQLALNGDALPRVTLNFQTGGPGLPRLAGRMEQRPGSPLVLRVTMAEYRAGTGRIAIPQLMIAQAPRGSLGFSGAVRLTGDLPGGRAENLRLPVSGNWSQAAGLSLWRRCVPVAFDALAIANLRLDRRTITLCPPGGGAIVRSGPRGLRIAVGAPALDLSGRLGDSAIRIASGPVGFAMPGALAARSMSVTLGEGEGATRFRLENLAATIGADVSGTFSGAEARLAAVPLDVLDAQGNWRFAGGHLFLTDAMFRVEDRQIDDRFQPLVARGASLTLADNRILAGAILREPQSDREVTRVAIRHDLDSGRGDADLAVDGIAFDPKLQPVMLSRLTLGVVANTSGTVRGEGRIDWTPDTITSTGRFTADSLDFAAAFGPTKGVSGTVEFTDLLGLVTAPDQRLRIASINPGIEATDGVLSFEMRPDSVLVVNGAEWPFLEGRLILEPTRMVLGVAETRRYTLTMEGLDAAKFVQRMELANISATGVFDGAIPLVFDENGGRIEGGALVARPPGGNVSYVGQLTWSDLSPMANFAFDALKSLDYRQMRIDLNGALEGEIVTRVSFDGIRQGHDAKRNFLTERLARLPIRFNVNLRAPFLTLVTDLRSLYDPSYIRDPRDIGKIDAQGRPIAAPHSDVQPPVSEARP